MTSAPVRDPLADHLITPQNSALLLIDYQPAQIAAVHSMDRDLLLKNAVSTVRTIKAFGVPVVHSTVNVSAGRGQPTLPELAGLLADDKPVDRTTVNSWEDIEFLQGCPRHRPPQADHLRPVDGDLHGLYRARRPARGI
jgi:nicotinamidase-related amidase